MPEQRLAQMIGSGCNAERSSSMRALGFSPVVPCTRSFATCTSQGPMCALAAITSSFNPDCDEMQGYLFGKPVAVEIFESRYLTPIVDQRTDVLPIAPYGVGTREGRRTAVLAREPL
jgi:hypothetical protein